MLAKVAHRTHIKRALCLILVFIFFFAAHLDSASAHKRRRARRGSPYRSALLVEAKTGRVLKAYRPRRRIYPASIVKMMTTLLAMEHLRRKKIGLRDVVTISRATQRVNNHQVHLRRGEKIRLKDLLKATMIYSANDAAHAVAEHVAGRTSRFVRLMNRRARQLGMSDTRFVNVNGLPPRGRRPANIMSARDASILARVLIKHPLVLTWTSKRTAPFRGRRHALVNTNRLMRSYPGMDGLKTGYYRRAGFSIVATAKQKNVRLISIVFGSRRSALRFREAKRLLTWGFKRYRKVKVGKNPYAVPLKAGFRFTPGGGIESFLKLAALAFSPAGQ